MKLLVIRHGIAADKKSWHADDASRPLTEEGRKKMRRNAAGLAAIVPTIDMLASSPLTRAQETARIVAGSYGDLTIETTELLEPNQDVAAILPWLETNRDRGTVAIVGHEPYLGILITYLLCGERLSSVDLKKGAAALLSIDGKLAGGAGVLEWFVTPSQLREMAR